MPVIFTDDFESGNFSAWTSTFLTAGAGLTVMSDQKHGGAYSAKATAPLVSTGIGARVQETIANNPSELYARFYVYLAGGFPMPSTAYFDIISLSQVNPTALSLVTIRVAEASGVNKWRIRVMNGTAVVTVDGSVVPLNQWVCVEVRIVKAVAGLCELYINGVLDAQAINIDTSAPILDTARFGLAWKPTGFTFAPILFFDDCVLSTEYIGPAVNPKLTINTNPELNVAVYVDNLFVGNSPLTVPVEPGTHTVRVEEEVTR